MAVIAKETWQTWVEIDLDAIAHNVRTIRQALADKVKLMAVVKADGYGHGMSEVAETALANGADCLGVTTLAEGLELRSSGFTVPVLILGITPTADAEAVVENDLTQTVCTADLAGALARAAQRIGKPCKVHLKIDTGLTRFGILPEDAVDFATDLLRLEGLDLEGVYTHFASPYEEDEYNYVQFQRFEAALQSLADANITIPLKHCANSAAMYEYPEMAMDMVRCGFILTNTSPARHAGRELPLRDALQWKTRVAYIRKVAKGVSIGYAQKYFAPRDMVIAIMQAGYADGIATAYGNKGKVLIGGKACPIVGGVCMSHIMVDISALAENVRIGDEVVLIGKQGDAFISVVEMAGAIGAGDAETLGRINHKLPRLYYRGEKLIKIK
ncbi:MAG: alanine racemase [bacterium]|jgi:alanine racemase